MSPGIHNDSSRVSVRISTYQGRALNRKLCLHYQNQKHRLKQILNAQSECIEDPSHSLSLMRSSSHPLSYHNNTIISSPLLNLAHYVLSFPLLFYFILRFYHTLFYPILSYSIQSYPILSYPIIFYPIMFSLILINSFLSFALLSYFYFILFYPALSYFILY